MFFNFNKCMLLSVLVLLLLRAKNGAGGVAGQLGRNGSRIGCLFGVVLIKFYRVLEESCCIGVVLELLLHWVARPGGVGATV